MPWKEFEKQCYLHIKNRYPQIKNVIWFGKSDSSKADIKIITQSDKEFFVEIKEPSSQCSQFVLFPNEDTKSFDFSRSNKSRMTESCKKIISVMNDSFDTLCKVRTAGMPIDVEKKLLYEWVHDTYSQKGVKYFITKKDDYMIFPLESFGDYFDIAAFYRRKACGSSEPNFARERTQIINGFKAAHIHGSIICSNASKKERCFLATDMQLNAVRVICDRYTYQFKYNEYCDSIAAKSAHVYEIRRLSNTSNPNFICQLTLKNNTQDPDDLADFIAEL